MSTLYVIKNDSFGRLNHANSHDNEEVDVKFSLDWVAYTRYFDFDTDLHPHALCDAMAREKWNKNFFEQLRMYVYFGRNLTYYISFIVSSIHLRLAFISTSSSALILNKDIKQYIE